MSGQVSSIRLKSIHDLLFDEESAQARYRIPDYQRGYRWTKVQVTQLLDDISEFIQSADQQSRKAFYCLQPLVVRRDTDGMYEVVDGQQRLTTIFLLLARTQEMWRWMGVKSFAVEYETRDTAFLANIDMGRRDEKPDYHYLCEAVSAIDEWMEGGGGTGNRRQEMNKLITHLLAKDGLERNVRVIWHELDPDEDPIAAFTRLNVGKIPLTDTELVRALFMRRAAKDDPTENLALQISYEWDQIEKRLQDPAFWYFLQNATTGDPSRISLIFRLIAHKSGATESPLPQPDDHSVFQHFSTALASTTRCLDVWQEVKKIFMALEEWYEDREIFHAIGFILHRRDGALKTIAGLLEESRIMGKAGFSRHLRGIIWREMFQTNPTGLLENDILQKITDHCQATRYGKKSVKDTLLFFNLATLLGDEKSNIRFQFDAFKQEFWDVEHIRSISGEAPSRREVQKSFLSQCLAVLRQDRQPDAVELLARISAYLERSDGSLEQGEFEAIHGAILRYFQEDQGEPVHDLGNLTLLDRGTNRGYGNAVFAVKRMELLKHDQSGVFVPLCTRNAFLKCYSQVVGNAMFWTKEDAEDYLNAICETIQKFFLKHGMQ